MIKGNALSDSSHQHECLLDQESLRTGNERLTCTLTSGHTGGHRHGPEEVMWDVIDTAQRRSCGTSYTRARGVHTGGQTHTTLCAYNTAREKPIFALTKSHRSAVQQSVLNVLNALKLLQHQSLRLRIQTETWERFVIAPHDILLRFKSVDDGVTNRKSSQGEARNGASSVLCFAGVCLGLGQT